jgi:hypothetical protein
MVGGCGCRVRVVDGAGVFGGGDSLVWPVISDGADFSGIQYVDGFVAILPPTATFNSSSQIQIQFVVFCSLGMVILYPMILVPLLRTPNLSSPKPDFRTRFLLPRRPREPETNKRALNWKRGVLFSLVYFGSLVATILGTIHLGNQRQFNSNLGYTAQEWSGNSVVLQSPTVAWYYSPSGTNLGDLALVSHGGWTLEIQPSNNLIQYISYPSFYPVMYNATCQAFNHSVGDVSGCVSGEFVNQPTVHYEPYNDADMSTTQFPEFNGTLNISAISPDPLDVLGVSNASIWTSAQAYQGIAGVYAPLGEWYLGNSTLLQVGWSLGGPCQGLQILLSKEYEDAAWIIVGMIWQWWVYWAEDWGGCDWDIDD